MKIDEGVENEFVGIINYSIMAMIQLADPPKEGAYDMTAEKASSHYHQFRTETKELMLDKNHDYGEAWRDMRISSITDLILMKLLRIKQIEENDGQTLISEGLKANYQDMLNYAVFAMILLSEKQKI